MDDGNRTKEIWIGKRLPAGQAGIAAPPLQPRWGGEMVGAELRTPNLKGMTLIEVILGYGHYWDTFCCLDTQIRFRHLHKGFSGWSGLYDCIRYSICPGMRNGQPGF